MTTDSTNISQRKEYLDFLRIIGSFAVIIIHVSSQYLSAVEVGSYEWRAFRSWFMAANWAVPVFCMISGSLFLSREIPFKTMLTKYIFRIAIAFVGWSAIYAVVFERANGIGTMIGSFVRGYSHLWYLYMLAGLYLITPILYRIASDEKMLKLFIVLGIIFSVCLPEAISVITMISERSGKYLSGAYTSIGMQTVAGYAMYYMLGYYLSRVEINSDKIIIIFGVMILSFLIPIMMLLITGKELNFLTGNFSLGDYLRSSSIFLISRLFFDKRQVKCQKMLFKLGECSFGVYLIHQMIITILNRWFAINTLSFNAAVSVPLIGIIVFLVAYLLTTIYKSVSRQFL